MQSINPVNDKVVGTYHILSNQEVRAVIESAHRDFLDWRETSFSKRSSLLRKVAENLKNRQYEYAKLVTQEMGKPIRESTAEIEKCAWVCEYYADNAERFLMNQVIETDAEKSYIRFDPLGVIGAIMPWNFPFWQVFRFAVPTLMAGNVGVLKHASSVSGCALAIEALFQEAGFPRNSFRALLMRHEDIAVNMIAHPDVRAITLTGSTQAGGKVAEIAGAHIKQVLLELGGSDPYIVLRDAHLDQAAALCVKSRMKNGGQSCIAAKRFIVEADIADQFTEKVIQYMDTYRMGDPLQPTTALGPMASRAHRDRVSHQVEQSIKKGAKCLLGGYIPNRQGAYYPPTVLTHVSAGMPAYDEELFGPVASLIVVQDSKAAIKVANDTSFGLGCAIFTKDLEYAEALAATIEAGNVAINDYVKSDPRLPFGGVKQSGYGRELAELGIRAFVNIKTVVAMPAFPNA